MIARRLVVTGHVQGVGYRAFVRHHAAQHGVAGWAENHADGSVVVWLQGAPDEVAAVESAVRQGPPHGHVGHAEGADAPPSAGLDGFAIR